MTTLRRINPTPVRVTFDYISQFTNVLVKHWSNLHRSNVRPQYLARFTQSERRTLTQWSNKGYTWKHIKNPPQYIYLSNNTLTLLNQAAKFFEPVFKAQTESELCHS